ncbi:MAG TPA: TatD family hydrolase [Mycobacteriales bacterium]|jgi:TatD DNase family protein|nr:TatD family hydrolase [Mycobacteriales bacterium]
MSQRRGELPPAPEPLPVEALDSHCHLDTMGCHDDADVALVLEQARAVGIRRVITAGDTVDSSQWCAARAGVHPDVYATVAVHPNETGELTDDTYDRLAALAALPQVVAVGETGLDYYWGRVEPKVQQEAFRRHIALAKQAGKALVIHDRDAHADILRVLREEGPPEHTVFHCFSGDAEMARECVAAGYVLSFAGTVTFKNAPALREAARLVPDGQLLVETDAPFLTPMPYRGRPNAPYLVPLTLRALAEATGRPVEALAQGVTATAARVFGLPA